MPLRLIATLALTASLAATAATAAAGAVGTTAATTQVTRGKATVLRVATRSLAPCSVQIRYSDGLVQMAGVKRARGGVVSWTIRIPNNAALGRAHWDAQCGGVVFHRSGTWVVTAAKAGTAASAPHVMVDKQGFSQRPNKYGSGSVVSYGLMLHNTSAHEDATNVYVLINFATAGGELIGTVTKSVALIPAGGVFALGDSMNMRTQIPMTKLEVTLTVNSHEAADTHPLPHFANVRVIPSESEPGWTGEVDGEVVNDTSPQTMSMAQISVVLFDASGAIVGGGTGMVSSPLPSGSRMVFLAQLGFTSIPYAPTVTPVISVVPTYVTDGA